MKPGDVYPENLRTLLARHGDTLITNPMKPDAPSAPLKEAVVECVVVDEKTGEKTFHLLDMLAEMHPENAAVVIADLAAERQEFSSFRPAAFILPANNDRPLAVRLGRILFGLARINLEATELT